MAVRSAIPDRSADFGRVHARLLRRFPQLVRDLGGDAAELLGRVGLEPQHCGTNGTVTYSQWLAVLELSASRLDVPDFGMRLAFRQGGAGVYGALGRVMRNSRTFGEALSFVARHNAAHSLAARIWKGQTASGQHVFLGHEILIDNLPARCQAIEQILLLGQLGAQVITGGRANARRVHFRHREISSAETYRRNFGCEVLFCQNEDGIAFRAEDMACPVHDADAGDFAKAASFVETAYGNARPPLSAQVRGIVMQRLGTGECSNDAVAAQLAIHPRTLHRKLRQEGTSFQEIKDEVRCDYMIYYLQQTDLEMLRISEKLGFSEQSAMSHFARNALGASPSNLRSRPKACATSGA